MTPSTSNSNLDAAPTPHSSLGATLAVFGLQIRRTRVGRKPIVAAVSVVLVLAAAIITRYTSEQVTAHDAVERALQYGVFGLLVFILPFLFSAGSISEEVESRTFVYLTARAVGRWNVVLGKYLAGTWFVWLFLMGAVALLYVGAFASHPRELLELGEELVRVISALTFLAFLYTAVCLFWGTLVPEAGGILSAVYLASVEFGGAWLPGPLRLMSMNYQAQQIAGLPKGGLLAEYAPNVSEGWAAAAAIALTMIFLAVAMVITRHREYRWAT